MCVCSRLLASPEKHKRTLSDTDNRCSKARRRAAIFVLMTSLPPLLVPVFMCWLGYSMEPASDCGGGGGGGLNPDTVLFCSSRCSGKRSYKTVCQPVLFALKFEIYLFSLSLSLSPSASLARFRLSLRACILFSHWLTSLPDSQAHCFIRSLPLA